MVRLFSQRHPAAVTLRHLGLLSLELLPPLKQHFGRQMMGLANHQPLLPGAHTGLAAQDKEAGHG